MMRQSSMPRCKFKTHNFLLRAKTRVLALLVSPGNFPDLSSRVCLHFSSLIIKFPSDYYHCSFFSFRLHPFTRNYLKFQFLFETVVLPKVCRFRRVAADFSRTVPTLLQTVSESFLDLSPFLKSENSQLRVLVPKVFQFVSVGSFFSNLPYTQNTIPVSLYGIIRRNRLDKSFINQNTLTYVDFKINHVQRT